MKRIKVVVPGSVVDVEVADDATVADVAREARVDETLEGRLHGRTISPDARASTAVADGDTLVFTAPALKHGDVSVA